MMDRFKVWGLDMMHPMWINMMLSARSNCAFQFIWNVFWMHGESLRCKRIVRFMHSWAK